MNPNHHLDIHLLMDDVNSTSSLVEGYYNQLELPQKSLIWLESGHGLSDGKLGQFVDVMTHKVLAETYPAL